MFVTGSLVHGGAERHSITVMNRLSERGHECHAVYVKNDPSQLGRIRLAGEGSVHCLDARRFLDWKAVEGFADHLRRVAPSLLVAANGYALMYSSLAAMRSGLRVPQVVTFHTTQVLGAKEHLKMLIDRPFFWRADRTVFVCENQQRYWLKRAVGSRSNEVIYNGVDTTHFNARAVAEDRPALRARLGLADSDYVIGLSAVMRPEKNHVQLVDAIAALRRKGIAARALMIGDGPLRPAVEARVRQLGLNPSDVLISGFQQEVRPWVLASDVMVLCSLAVETFSLAALEAMAMGRPVVHADLGGASEMIIPGHNGFLFPVGDTAELVRHLAHLSQPDIAAQMGANARCLVESRFSEAAMVDRYEKSLSQLLAGPSPKLIAKLQGLPKSTS